MPYPPLDTTAFTHSIREIHNLLQQAESLLARLSEGTYAYRLMEAAQAGEQDRVDSMIHSIDGINGPIKTVYTPSGIIFSFGLPTVNNQNANCCDLEMTLKWGK